MRVNINKLQNGGGFASFTPIINAHPRISSGNSSNQTESKKEDDEDSLLDKTTIDILMKEGGLQNDVEALMNEIRKLESESPFSYNQKQTRISSIDMISRVNKLRQNKDLWNKAIKFADSMGGLGEVAIGASGEVFSKQDDGKIIAMSLSTYKKNKDKIQLLTVSEILSERNDNPYLTGKNSIFSVADNAIGVNKIVMQISDIVSRFGSEDFEQIRTYDAKSAQKEISEITGKKITSDEMHSLEVLSNLQESPSGYNKVKIKGSSERKNALSALNYIWSTLGQSAQRKLQTVAVMNGHDDPRQYILDLILNQTDESYSSEVTPIEVPDGSAGSKSTSQKSLTQFQMFFNNDLKGLWTDFMINDTKVGALLKGAIGSKGPLVDKNDNHIPMGKLSNVFMGYQYASLVDISKVMFGDKLVTSENFPNIIYDAAEDSGILFFPTDENENPDWNRIKLFNDVNKAFEANKAMWSETDIKDHFSRYGFDVNIQDSEVNGRKVKVLAPSHTVKPFLVMSGYTNDAVTSIVDDNNMISRLTDSELSSMKPYFESFWRIGEGKNAISTVPKKGFISGMFGTPYYKSIITVPIKPEASVVANALVGQGPTKKLGSIDEVKYNIKNSSTHYTGGVTPVTSSAILNNSK